MLSKSIRQIALLTGLLLSFASITFAEEHSTAHGPGVDLAPQRIAVGDPAPAVVIRDWLGMPFPLRSLDGHPTVLVFFMDHACSGCLDQLTTLGKSAEDFTQAGARIYAISSNDPADSRDTLKTLKSRGVTGITILSDPTCAAIKAYGVKLPDQPISFHSIFLIDANGTIRLVARGDAAPANLPSAAILLAKLHDFAAPPSN